MNLLLTGAFKYTKGQLNSIQDLGYNITLVQDERVSLSEANQNIDIAAIDAVVCNSLFLYNDINQFKSLKFLQLTSAGMDRVSLDYIKNHGIQIANARGIYSIPMAEWVVLKILEIYKNSRHFYKAQSERKWQKQRGLLELAGKTAASPVKLSFSTLIPALYAFNSRRNSPLFCVFTTGTPAAA
jgi:phosphoglycerate dehydrogenase-like enzyme